jgi:large subunit ribosomal protein L35
MPKMKTHKGAQARFRMTGTGKIMRIHGGKSHLRRRKANRTKRLYDEMVPVNSKDTPRLKRLLPYGVK